MPETLGKYDHLILLRVEICIILGASFYTAFASLHKIIFLAYFSTREGYKSSFLTISIL